MRIAHAIERAVILSEGELLDIHLVISNQPAPESANQVVQAATTYDTFNLEELEHRAVRAALKHFKGNVTQAAKALGLTRGAMYRRLEKYDL